MDWNTLIIGAIVGAIVTLPIAIFGNLISPWVKSYWDKGSLSIRERRILVLMEHYKVISYLKNIPSYGTYYILRRLAISVLGVFALVGVAILHADFYGTSSSRFGSYTNMILVIAFLLMYMLGFLQIFSVTKDITETLDFMKFRKKTLSTLINLGVNPEELDKIDKEMEENKNPLSGD